MELAIAILNYNTKDTLLRCLTVLQERTKHLSCEVFVVDNGSRDASAEAVASQFPNIHLIALPENQYFAAYNLAFEKSRAELFLILSSDIEIRDDILDRLLAQAREQVKSGAWGARMYFPDGRLQQNGSADYPLALAFYTFTALGKIMPGRSKRLYERVFLKDWDRMSSRQVAVLPDSFLLIRRQVFERESLYDPQFKLYFTENDLCMRIRQKGWEIHYLAEGHISHIERGSVDRVDPAIISKIYRSDIAAYFRKYYGNLPTLALCIGITLTRWTVLFLHRTGLRRFKRNLVWGIA